MLAVSGRTLQYARTQEANLGGQNVLLPVGCSPSCTPPVAVQHQRLHFCGEVCWPSQQQTFEARWHDGHSFRGHNSLPLVGLAAQPTPPSLRMAALQQMIDLCALTPSGRPRQLGQLGRQLGGAASVALSWFKNHTPSGSSRHSVLRCLSLAPFPAAFVCTAAADMGPKLALRVLLLALALGEAPGAARRPRSQPAGADVASRCCKLRRAVRWFQWLLTGC